MKFVCLLWIGGAIALQPLQSRTKAPPVKQVAKLLASSALAVLCVAAPFGSVAGASEKRNVASISASGFVFKDKLIIDAFPDPKAEGVTLYISDFERPLTERLQKDFFSDPSQAGLACARRSAPIVLADSINRSGEGEDVIAESKSLLFKTLRVKRIVDKEANALVYVSYSTRLNKDDDSNKARFASSLCSVSLDP